MYSCIHATSSCLLPHRKSPRECQKKCQHEWDLNKEIFQHIKDTVSAQGQGTAVSFIQSSKHQQEKKRFNLQNLYE